MVDTFLYPGARPLAATHLVETMAVAYPPLNLIVFGVRIDWLVAFLLFSLAFGFVSKGVIGVELYRVGGRSQHSV